MNATNRRQGGIGKRLRWFPVALGALSAGLTATVAFAVTPTNGGPAGGTEVIVDDSAGEQLDPRVSGEVVTYTDYAAAGGLPRIRYYDFSDGSTSTVPPEAAGDIDTLSNVDGSRISFARQKAGDPNVHAMVFDLNSNMLFEIAPGSGVSAFSTAVGGDTIAVVDIHPTLTDLTVGSISNPSAPLANVSQSPDRHDHIPAVSPAGTAVVWQSCDASFSDCTVLKSTFSGAGWGAAQTVSTEPGNEMNPDTDGIHVVYDADRSSSLGGSDIYFQPLEGGPETQLAIDGQQLHPSISQGVIAFESKESLLAPADVFVYVIATNTLYQVTSTSEVHETLSDLTVLANGDVRVVWAAAPIFGNDIYARTFSPAAPVYDFDGFFPPVENLPVLNLASAGSAIPVRFSLGGDQGLNIFAPGYPASSPISCEANDPGSVIEETVTPGASTLSYDPATDRYRYVWKTQHAWKGTCRMLVIRLNDGSQHLAKFKFK